MGRRFDHVAQQHHETLAAQRLAVRSEEYWEYQPDQQVQTTDGFPGRVTAVNDGPFPGAEEYEVTLDGGMGGGTYTASQLRPAAVTTAVLEQTAAADYPELAQILVERPDPAGVTVFAAKQDDDSQDDDDQDDDQDDSDDGSEDDGDDDAPPWAKKSSALFSSLIITAAADRDFRFHVTAAWRDVVAKAKRLRSEGRLRVTLASDGYVFAEVKGDHQVYETGLQRLPGRTAAHSWSCGCKWGAYHWGADDDFSRFAGRMCSHALALQYEAQSRGMFGRNINADEEKPAWVPRKVVVRYDIDADQHRLAPSTARTAGYDYYGEWDGHDDDAPDNQAKSREWDNIHSGLDGIHRGLGVHLHPSDHAIVHDESRPLEERAHHLLKSLPGSIHGQEGSVGWHWTSDDGVAESFGETGSQNTAKDRDGNWREGTSVVLHAHTPERHDINEHPDESQGNVYGYHDHGEREVPLRSGASVSLKGVSWKPMHDVHDAHGDLVEEHSDRDYTRHDFGGQGHHVYAFLRQPSAGSPLQMAASAAVRSGENREDVAIALGSIGVTASVDAPFGEPSGTSYQLPKAPGATSPKVPWENPASAGPLAGADPAGWNRKLPLESFAALDESALFEPGGAEADLHEEPEGALPATDGVQIPSEDESLTPSMAGLKRQALKSFTLAEREALINEGENVRAANLDRLEIDGTHYADLEQILAAQEDDTTWLS
ncbi:hypothetical protein [Streptomyces sp. cg35]|uniref:hypothetical protein n=1 Tax=Streptomyces sp. cg35 TaxID=3421650 RepID=UPI003D17C645